jgi:Tripartite tricarboxylate transporter family receptor
LIADAHVEIGQRPPGKLWNPLLGILEQRPDAPAQPGVPIGQRNLTSNRCIDRSPQQRRFARRRPVMQKGYPTKLIKFIVTFSPGGFTDVMARIVAQHRTEQFGQPFLVENRPGASTVIGTDTVARAAPDGYALLYTRHWAFLAVPFAASSGDRSIFRLIP